MKINLILFLACFTLNFSAATELVKDLNTNTGPKGSETDMLVKVGSQLAFKAKDPNLGTELFISDGTEVNTKMLVDLQPGEDGGLYLSNVISDGNFAFFRGSISSEKHIWATNGGDPIKIIENAVGNMVAAFAIDNEKTMLLTGSEVFLTDKTLSGTSKILTLNFNMPFDMDFDIKPYNSSKVLIRNQSVYFNTGTGIWRINGLTKQQTSIVNFDAGTKPTGLISFGDYIYIYVNGASGYKIFAYSDLDESVTLIADKPTGSVASGLLQLGQKLIFVEQDYINSQRTYDLYEISGKDIVFSMDASGVEELYNAVSYKDGVVFSKVCNNNSFNPIYCLYIFKPDLSFEELLDVNTEIKSIDVRNALASEEAVYLFYEKKEQQNIKRLLSVTKASFKAADLELEMEGISHYTEDSILIGNKIITVWGYSGNKEPYVIDLNSKQAGILKEINPSVNTLGSAPSDIFSSGGYTFFKAATTSSDNYHKLIKSNGTEIGTSVILSDTQNYTVAAQPSYATQGDYLYFTGRIDSRNGIIKLNMFTEDMQYVVDGFRIKHLQELNDNIIFSAEDPIYGQEFFSINTQTEEVSLVSDINPGIASSDPRVIERVANKLYFRAADNQSMTKIWHTDGTTNGTGFDIIRPPLNLSSQNNILVYENHYIVNSSSDNGKIIIINRNDKTETSIPGISTHGINFLYKSESGFVFIAGDYYYYYDIEGKSLELLGAREVSVYSFHSFLEYDGDIYFVKNNVSLSSDESILQKYSITDKKVEDIFVTTDIFYGSLFKNKSDLFFLRSSNLNGVELWKTNGSSAGTVKENLEVDNYQLEDFASFFESGGNLIFPAKHQIYDKELFIQKYNQIPIANNDVLKVNMGESIGFNLLNNDQDTDDDLNNSNIKIIETPKHGTLSDSGNDFVYQANTSFYGQEILSYILIDNKGAYSNNAMVRITVNSIPSATDDNYTTRFETVLIADILSNDSDLDGILNINSIKIIDTAANGSIEVLSDGRIKYEPNSGFSGMDSFTYTIEDNDGAASNVGSVSITVSEQPPTPPSRGGGSGGGAISLLVLLLLIVSRTKYLKLL